MVDGWDEADSLNDEVFYPDVEIVPQPRTEWGSCSLGTPGDKAAETLLPLILTTRSQSLAVFVRAGNFGDPTKASDEFISVITQGNWEGGGQVDQSKEGTDVSRYYDGTIDASRPFNNALGPLVQAVKPSGASGSAYCLGDAYSTVTKRPSTMYHCFGTAVRGIDPAASHDSTAPYYAGSASLTAEPVGVGFPYRGRGADTLLWIPLGDSGYATLSEAIAGTPIVANYAGSATRPKAIAFANVDGELYCIDKDGYLWENQNDGVGWSKHQRAQSEVGGTKSPLIFDLAEEPRSLIRFVDKGGAYQVYLATDQGVWWLNQTAESWVKTAIEFSPNTNFGTSMAVWRPGEDLWVAMGVDIVRLTSGNAIVPDSGLLRDHGIPVNLRGKITAMQPGLNALYIAVAGNPATGVRQAYIEDAGLADDDAAYLPSNQAYPSIWAWTSRGWHRLWEDPAAGGDPTTMGISKIDASRLWWGSKDGYMRKMFLRTGWVNARAGREALLEEYAESSYIETSQFDMEMEGFDKQGSHITFNTIYADTGNYIDVSYRTDRVPNWTTLGRLDTTERTRVLAFDRDGDGWYEGETFNWIQFRLALQRDANYRNSPILDSFSMSFMKIPKDTDAMQFTVPLPMETWGPGLTAKQIIDRLKALRVESNFLKLDINERSYRGTLTGLTTVQGTGTDYQGGITVNFVAIKTGLEAPFESSVLV